PCEYAVVTDTIEQLIYVPIDRVWRYVDANGNHLVLNDTTFFSIGNNTYAIVLEVGASYMGSQSVTFWEIWNGHWISPRVSLSQEVVLATIYETEVVDVVVNYIVPINTCCSNYKVGYGTSSEPPDSCFCSPIRITYCPPPPIPDVYYPLCEGDPPPFPLYNIVQNGECIQVQQIQLVYLPSPQVSFYPLETITCNSPIVQLQCYEFWWTYDWSGPGIVSGNGSNVIMVDEPGAYEVTVSDENGCIGTAIVDIQENIQRPQAVLTATGSLSCTLATIALSTAGSSVGNIYQYQTTTSNGHIVSGQNSPNPIVDEPGIYTLTVTNTQNGCQQTASASVNGQTGTVVFAGNDTLVCGYQYTLSGSPAGGDWQVICAPENGLVAFDNANNSETSVSVSECGEYIFVYSYSAPDCNDTDTVRITFDIPVVSETLLNLDISPWDTSRSIAMSQLFLIVTIKLLYRALTSQNLFGNFA
ncbi:MAG: hypothetical protein R2795_20925, partial [Saprospiraceae bacterium]